MLFITKAMIALAASLSSVWALPTASQGEPPFSSLAAENSTIAAPQFYSGPWYDFPQANTWKEYDALFNGNGFAMRYNGNTESDVSRIYAGINIVHNEYAAQNKVIDRRVILAIIMQESQGDVAVKTTYTGDNQNIPTAGIMQCSYCPGFPGRHGLSQDEITSMIRGGVNHYWGNMVSSGSKNHPETYYPALRLYNSGSVNLNDLSDGRGATPSYVSDVVQRLGGWTN